MLKYLPSCAWGGGILNFTSSSSNYSMYLSPHPPLQQTKRFLYLNTVIFTNSSPIPAFLNPHLHPPSSTTPLKLPKRLPSCLGECPQNHSHVQRPMSFSVFNLPDPAAQDPADIHSTLEFLHHSPGVPPFFLTRGPFSASCLVL